MVSILQCVCVTSVWLCETSCLIVVQVYNQAPKLFPDLLQMLTDDCNEVGYD